MPEYIPRAAAIAYIREQSEECQKAFEELGGESGIYADAYNDLAEDFYRIPAADVILVVRCGKCKYLRPTVNVHTGEQVGCWCSLWDLLDIGPDDFCSRGKYQTDGGAE